MDTPLRHQYLRIKKRFPDTILFFRLGDFYETFDDDARIVAQVCDIVLTSRPVAKDRRVPMAGVPHHAVDTYVAKLLAAGHKVAVCDQLSEPGRGLVERDVIRVITPGTVVEPNILPAGRNNYIAAVLLERGRAGLAYADVSTGEFATTELRGEEAPLEAHRELSRLQPAELLLPDDATAAEVAPQTALTHYPNWHWQEDAARQSLLDYFAVERLEGFGCEGKPLAVRAAGALLQYLQETQQGLLRQIRSLRTYSTGQYMTLDPQTRRNLELTANTLSGEAEFSLVWVLDQTRTPMGQRLLRRWVNQPLLELAPIAARLDAVERFAGDTALRSEVRAMLAGMRDVERITSRVLSGIAGPRELLGLRASLENLPALRDLLEPALAAAAASASPLLTVPDPCPEVAGLIGRAIVEEAPVVVSAGGVIRPGFSSELDQIVSASREAREWIAGLEDKERARTGIRTLKVGYNKVFGYYIEITKALEKKAPPEYIRKQTLVNAERYITPELKEYESIVLGAQERMAEVEARLYKDVLAQIAAAADRLLGAADALARLDVCAALAEVAVRNRYVRPQLNEGEAIQIKAGRHPVVELTLKDEPFIPNDLDLDCNDAQTIVLTGANMSGKCLSAGTLVVTDRGIVPIASLSPDEQAGGFMPLQIRVKGKTGPAQTSHFYSGGYQRTAIVRTQLGFEIEGTLDHRIWTRFPDGHEDWKALAEIQAGDVVALDTHLDLWGNETEILYQDDTRKAIRHHLPTHLSPDLAYIMGLLVGDGTLSYKGSTNLSNLEPSIRADFQRIVQEQFDYAVGIKNNGKDMYISSVQIRRFLAHLGLGYKRAHQKYIPSSILRAPRQVIVAFLQGLFDTDGYADTRYGNVSLSTSSHRLAQEVQLVLLNLGIVSSVRLKKTKRRDNYLVTIFGIDAIHFYERIGFRLERKQARRGLASDTRMPNEGGIPYLEETLQLIRARIVATPNKPLALKHASRIGSIFRTYIPNGRNVSYAKLGELIDYCHLNGIPCPELETIKSNGYFYDRVVSIEAGGGDVYDLTVPEGKAFVAGGFVNHNSTYLREVALIVLMAQIGSFVPAESATIGLVDRIFTRVGAQDDIATGRSTFMVEMTETANILHHATRRSLIVLDEIGRGTSTYDGLAVARAVLEYIHNHPRLGSRTIFATHYHELTEMAQVLPRVRNYNVAVTEERGRVVFLHKIVPGGADRSYGIHVAQLAGLPGSVIHRAEEVLATLEQRGDKEERREAMRQTVVVKQLSLFGGESPPALEELKKLRVEELTPLEAINKLYELKKLAEEEGQL